MWQSFPQLNSCVAFYIFYQTAVSTFYEDGGMDVPAELDALPPDDQQRRTPSPQQAVSATPDPTPLSSAAPRAQNRRYDLVNLIQNSDQWK